MAFMVDDDYALALRLQEEFDCESAITVRDDNTSGRDKWSVSEVGEISRPIPPPAPSSLIDSSWELIDPNPDARALFLEFNDKYFWGSLGGVEVRWSPRMTLCAGVCVYEGRGGMCSIRLSEPLLKLRPRKDLIETLLHEMIHAYLFVTNNDRDRDGHGPEFLKHMHRLNKATGTRITVYHDFHDEVDNYRTHWWRCDGPCQSRKPYFGYVKRSMNRPPSSRDFWWSDHQRACGGTYTKIKEPEDYGVKKNKKTQLEKTQTSEKTNTRNIGNWLQKTSAQPNSSNSGKGLELIGKGTSVPTSCNDKTASAAAGASDVIDVAFISDDELLLAVDELEKNFAVTQPQMEFKSNEGHCNVLSKAERISGDCAVAVDASQISSTSSSMKELPELPLKKLEFPGKGIVLGTKSSKPSDHQQNRSSVGQVLRRLPGIGFVEVRAAVAHGKMLEDVDIIEFNNAGKIAANRTNNVESDELSVWKHTEEFSKKLSENKYGCTNEDQSRLDRIASTGGANVGNRKSSNTSNDRINVARKNDKTGFHKTKTDIRFWLNDQSRAVGEVIRVPNFISVGNPRFQRAKEEQENALPSVKIPRKFDKQDARPAKKIRLDNELDFELAAASNRHINSSETNSTDDGACGRGTDVDYGRGRFVDNKKTMIAGNNRGGKVDNEITIVDDSKGIKVDNGRTANLVNSIGQSMHNSPATNVDKCRTIVDVGRAADVAVNIGSDRTDSLDHRSVVKTDCVTLCSDDSDFDETQTIASVISRIKASVSIDDVASKGRGGSSPSDGITSIKPLQLADVISGSGTPQDSSEHLDSRLPNHAPCPACGFLVEITAINEHLDQCLN